MFTARPQTESIERLKASWQPVNGMMEKVGFFCLQQVHERFITQGASGGKAWPPKRMKDWGYDDGRSILTGHSASLRKSFQYYATPTRAVVFSDVPYAKTHQLGTVGKGGILPTIVPRKAKALFIPVTDRAITAERFSGGPAARIRSVYGMPRTEAPIRAATRGPKVKGNPEFFAPLVAGRLHDGKLQKKNRQGKWVDGTPDFIFLTKVDIAPRPMLPDSAMEREAQRQFVVDSYRPTMAGK